MTTAWRYALQFTATLRRNTTSVSASGATRFVYADILTGVLVSVQESGGRLRQDDVGQKGLRKVDLIFGEEMLGVLKQNDLLVLDLDGRTFRITHLHEIVDLNAPHVEGIGEQVVSAGGD